MLFSWPAWVPSPRDSELASLFRSLKKHVFSSTQVSPTTLSILLLLLLLLSLLLYYYYYCHPQVCQVDDESNLLEVDALAGIVGARQHLDDCEEERTGRRKGKRGRGREGGRREKDERHIRLLIPRVLDVSDAAASGPNSTRAHGSAAMHLVGFSRSPLLYHLVPAQESHGFEHLDPSLVAGGACHSVAACRR